MSSDGRFVAFISSADNLVLPPDRNENIDVFVHDLVAGQTHLVSRHTNGTQGNNESFDPAISADGRFVAFTSYADNLSDIDLNDNGDIFVHDINAGQTFHVSVNSNGVSGGGESSNPSISDDGRYVAFNSTAHDLVNDDLNGFNDVFVHDRLTGETTLVSRHGDGTQANNDSGDPSISADGRFVAFSSYATNLIEGGSLFKGVFVHDRQTGQTTLVSRNTNGTPANDNTSGNPSISANGRFVVFESGANNLVDDDTNNQSDIFIHDRETGQTTLISRNTNGTQGNMSSSSPSVSADGRFVAFQSEADNLISIDANFDSDVFLHNLQTGQTSLISRHSNGTQGYLGSFGPSISADGRSLAFTSAAFNLVDNDTGNYYDVFISESD